MFDLYDFLCLKTFDVGSAINFSYMPTMVKDRLNIHESDHI